MTHPILSIITINLNNSIGLQNTLTSIQQQKCDYYEHIIIDGGSNDKSKKIIKQYSIINPHLSYWISEQDNGIYNAMNKGILQAKGEYLLFLNSGDYLEPNILNKIKQEITGEGIIYGDLYYISSENQEKTLITFPDPPLNASLVISRDFYLPHPASLIKRQLFDNELYNEHYKIISDWDFWVKCIILKNCTTKHISMPISNFMEGGISSTNQELIQAERAEALQHLFPPQIIDSLNKLFFLEQSPLCKVILEIKSSKRFFRRMARLIIFCHKIHKLFTRHK